MYICQQGVTMHSFWPKLMELVAADPIAIGDRATVSHWEWVTILNEKPIRNANITGN